MPNISQQFVFLLGTATQTTNVSIPSSSVAPDGSSTFYSRPEKGDGYYGSGDGIHTITYTVTPGFKGALSAQATLATTPKDTDWFDVVGTTQNYNTTTNIVITTTTNYVNFTGNFVWVRTKVARVNDPFPGTVLFVNYNH
jgi:hypothetical protein